MGDGGRSRDGADRRAIYNDVVWLLRHYSLRVSAAREAGHHTHGDGTAVDLVPATGTTLHDWDDSAGQLARDLGWTARCGSSGARPMCPLKPAIQFIGYDGYPLHGSPRTCTGDCPAHIHVSWVSGCYGSGGSFRRARGSWRSPSRHMTACRDMTAKTETGRLGRTLSPDRARHPPAGRQMWSVRQPESRLALSRIVGPAQGIRVPSCSRRGADDGHGGPPVCVSPKPDLEAVREQSPPRDARPLRLARARPATARPMSCGRSVSA